MNYMGRILPALHGEQIGEKKIVEIFSHIGGCADA
jgi:hypothetical protein